MAARIEVSQLNKSFEKLQVLQDLSLTVKESERVVLLGPSGSGKTTLLRLAAGLEAPTSGRIEVSSRQISFVFQEPRLIPWRSVAANLAFVNPEAHIATALKKMRLEGFEEYRPAQLSGGMQQRVNLARALINEPDLLIMDEAFSSLDLPFKMQLMKDLASEWRAKRFTMLAVTHDLKEALFIGDRILILSGRPARISHDFAVELPEIRNFSDPALLSLESKLLEILEQS